MLTLRREDEHGRVAGALELLFAGEPALEEPLAVRAHLRGCPVCARRFEELAALDRVMLVHDDDADDSFEARYTAAVVAALAAQAAAPATPPTPWAALAAWLQGTPRLGWGLAAAGLALGALALLVAASQQKPRPLPEQERFAARGAASSQAVDRGVRRFEMFCVAPDPGGAARFAEADTAGRLRCPAGAELKFAVLNASPAGEAPLDHLAFFGVDAAGAVRWFQPVPATHPDLASVHIGEAPRLRPLGETLRLTGAAGVVRVYGVFTAGPLERSALEARVRAQVRPGLAPGTLDLDGLSTTHNGERARLGSGDAGRYGVTSRVLEIEPAPTERP